MNLTSADQRDIDALPPALRTLLDDELAAGNAIAEIGHSHPAPPVGAYLLLARRVSTRVRVAGDGLVFSERNSSLYSGEFTDANRHYFLLEPPLPPPAEPDMDAIRRAAYPEDSAAAVRAERAPGSVSVFAYHEPGDRAPEPATRVPAPVAVAPGPPFLESTRMDRTLVFRDRRPPHELQAELERTLLVCLAPDTAGGRLKYAGVVKNIGATYQVCFALEAALSRSYEYSLRFEVSWADLPPVHHAYFQRSSASWIDLWTRPYTAAERTQPEENRPARYAGAVAGALQAEAAVSTVPALQQAIISALQAGATFATSHKEGGTRIRWEGGVFVRADYGESERREVYGDEAEFLAFLRQFYDAETSRAVYPAKIADVVAWRLIWRLLRRD